VARRSITGRGVPGSGLRLAARTFHISWDINLARYSPALSRQRRCAREMRLLRSWGGGTRCPSSTHVEASTDVVSIAVRRTYLIVLAILDSACTS
jgi:hypothetical protein